LPEFSSSALCRGQGQQLANPLRADAVPNRATQSLSGVSATFADPFP
jgi:hypothetical protein